jgi:hypothetical protein
MCPFAGQCGHQCLGGNELLVRPHHCSVLRHWEDMHACVLQVVGVRGSLERRAQRAPRRVGERRAG